MTSTLSATNSAASVGKRSIFSSAERNWNRILRPSTAGPVRVRAGIDRRRAWDPLLSPRSPPSCRRPRGRQEQTLAGARYSRVPDHHSTRRRMQCAAGAKGWLRRTEQKDGTKAQNALCAVPGHPFTSARRPNLRNSWRNSGRKDSASTVPRVNAPIRCLVDCSATAANGQLRATPLRSVTNSRRFIRSPRCSRGEEYQFSAPRHIGLLHRNAPTRARCGLGSRAGMTPSRRARLPSLCLVPGLNLSTCSKG
jgi:hypothetical protein